MNLEEKINQLRRLVFRFQDRLALSASESRAMVTLLLFALCGMAIKEYRLSQLPDPMEPISYSRTPNHSKSGEAVSATVPLLDRPKDNLNGAALKGQNANADVKLEIGTDSNATLGNHGEAVNPDEIRVNINEASVVDLQVLPGIGPAIAQRIVNYRTKIGRFRSIEELEAVRGIGPKTLAKMKSGVRL